MNKFDKTYNIIMENINNVNSIKKPDFDKMQLLVYFNYNDLQEIMKFDKENEQMYQNELKELIDCIENFWNNGNESKEEMYKTRTVGHFTIPLNTLKHILDICKQYSNNLQLQHIYNKNIKVYNDFIEYKETWPESEKYRWGCRCGHFGGLQKEDSF